MCVTQGSVYDVAIDMRRSSFSFGQWYGIELSAENNKQLWAPLVLPKVFILPAKRQSLFIYHPQSEVRLCWKDPQVPIYWPLVNGQQPNLSAKDQSGIAFGDAPTFS